MKRWLYIEQETVGTTWLIAKTSLVDVGVDTGARGKISD